MFRDNKPFFFIEDYEGSSSCYQDLGLLTQNGEKILTETDAPVFINKQVICEPQHIDPVLRNQSYEELLTEDNQKLYA